MTRNILIEPHEFRGRCCAAMTTMPDVLRSLRDRMIGATVFRGCRCAQPPANGWHPSGMTPEGCEHVLRSLRDRMIRTTAYRGCRCAQPPANGWHPFGMAARDPGVNCTREPGGFGTISRWLRSAATTPPVSSDETDCIPEGCQHVLRSLQDAGPSEPTAGALLDGPLAEMC